MGYSTTVVWVRSCAGDSGCFQLGRVDVCTEVEWVEKEKLFYFTTFYKVFTYFTCRRDKGTEIGVIIISKD